MCHGDDFVRLLRPIGGGKMERRRCQVYGDRARDLTRTKGDVHDSGSSVLACYLKSCEIFEIINYSCITINSIIENSIKGEAYCDYFLNIF